MKSSGVKKAVRWYKNEMGWDQSVFCFWQCSSNEYQSTLSVDASKVFPLHIDTLTYTEGRRHNQIKFEETFACTLIQFARQTDSYVDEGLR